MKLIKRIFKITKYKLIPVTLAGLMLLSLSACGNRSGTENTETDLVEKLSIAQSVRQIITVEASGSTATVTMHVKDSDGVWSQLLSTSGYIGRNGIGKTSEGDGKTPTGIYHFTTAFGNKENPGTAFDYTQTDSSWYWVDDQSSAYYNRFVSTDDVKCDWSSAEHISDYPDVYAYVLALDYNSSCTPGDGSAIFLHCSGGKATAGCIAIPESCMLTILQNISTDCIIIIDSADNLENY